MNKAICKKIYFLVNTQGLPYNVVAEKLGLPEDHFQHLLEGKVLPTPRTLQKLASLFHVKPEFFSESVKSKTIPSQATPESQKTPLTLKDLTVKLQALIECLVDKKIITPHELKQKNEQVDQRVANKKKKKESEKDFVGF